MGVLGGTLSVWIVESSWNPSRGMLREGTKQGGLGRASHVGSQLMMKLWRELKAFPFTLIIILICSGVRSRIKGTPYYLQLKVPIWYPSAVDLLTCGLFSS